jgi:peptide/nickel transport system permease protein
MLPTTENTSILSSPARFSRQIKDLFLLARYLLLRAAGIFLTIIIGIFIVVVVMNQEGFIDQAILKDANQSAKAYLYEHPTEDKFASTRERDKFIADLSQIFADQEGVNLPYWPRQLQWTWNMLTFRWGDVKGIEVTDAGVKVTFRAASSNSSSTLRLSSRLIVTQHFPNTLLIVGTAYILIFAFGLPLALRLSRQYNSRLDRIISSLAPLSSIPSWAYGILLVSIFAFQLHWLPASGKYDLFPPNDSQWGYIPIVARHMVLPVTAIILSTFFQVAYIWRTYFLLYSEEDYVTLAIAKGLSSRVIEFNYILRPALPYIVTNFVLTLASFWQMTTALEYFFNWPGIGWMYFRSLLMDDLIVSLGVVVIFAYVLGGIVLLLDLAYMIFDPRIRLTILNQAGRQVKIVPARGFANRNRISFRLGKPRIVPREWWARFSEWLTWTARPLFSELRHYPSALAGLTLIVIFLIASIYAMVVYPYNQLDSIWNPQLSQYITKPEFARPLWFNWFRVRKLPENQIIDSRTQKNLKTYTANQNGGQNISITYTFDVPDGDFPQNVILYTYTKDAVKKPFFTAIWITPDGREFNLKNATAINENRYDLSKNIPNRYLDARFQHPGLVITKGGESPHKVLFADPISETLIPIAGTYQLRLNVITFEPKSDFDGELVILGQVYGWAGTDHLRRELSVGLLWGLPVALGIGMLGALTTSVFAMLIAAVSAWMGGWVDGLAQRITEGNMMLPVLAIGVLLAKYFHISIWAVLAIAILLNAFGGTTRAYRASFLQVKEAPYIEAARAYGATDLRIILHYMIPRIFPVMIPQVVMLVPGYVFLEATLAIFHVSTPYAPTWGRIIYDALTHGVLYGNYYWILQPIILLLITSLAFAMLGFTLDRVLNPRLLTS